MLSGGAMLAEDINRPLVRLTRFDVLPHLECFLVVLAMLRVQRLADHCDTARAEARLV